MSISLSKGGNISLSKVEPGLKRIIIGLGWDARSTDGQDFDLDSSAIVLGANGKVIRGEDDFCFYNQLSVHNGAIRHSGDNLTGGGDGDDEKIGVDLEKVPADRERIVFPVTIDRYEERRQNFGQVSNAFIRIVNADTKREIARFDLSEDASTETAMIFAELYRNNGEWKFRAIGQGYAGGLKAISRSFGLDTN